MSAPRKHREDAQARDERESPFPFRRLRVAFKTWLARRRLIIEFCKDCGRTQPLVWWCRDNALWERLWGSDGGVLCPECFDRRAIAAGLSLRWFPEVEWPHPHGDSRGDEEWDEKYCTCVADASMSRGVCDYCMEVPR